MQYTITALNGDTVRIESENWMIAMGKALVFFDLDIDDVERLVCSPGPDSTVFVEEPERDRSWMVRLTQSDVTAKVSERSELEDWVRDEVEVEISVEDSFTPSSLNMPVATTLTAEPVLTHDLLKSKPTTNDESLADDDWFGGSEPISQDEDLKETARPADRGELKDEPLSMYSIDESGEDNFPERLFELGMELYATDRDGACQLALELLMETTRASAGSVVRGTMNDDALRFAAASGPVGAKLIGRRIEFGEGLVGMCFDVRGTLQVNDVSRNTRHLDQFDGETGFKTVSAVCAPILDEADSLIYGVVQLLNPPMESFTLADVQKAEQVASTLAERLRQAD